MRICYTQILIFVSLEASLEVDLSSTLDQISMSLYSLHHLYLSYTYIKKKKRGWEAEIFSRARNILLFLTSAINSELL